jgi:Holliday junction resolvase RusA-like endonuclease
MNGIIYLDDSQIEVLEGSKKYSKDNWCIEIIVELL